MDPLVFAGILIALLIACVLVLRWLIMRVKRAGRWPAVMLPRSILVEITVVIIWAIWVGHAYLNPDPQAWPFGSEYGLSMQSHFVWQTFSRCGACVMWNGGIDGGAPAFVELQGAVLHPFVVIGSVLFGANGGAKLTLIGSLVTAGLAQWWLARVLGLSRTARLWSAGLVIVGGHLAGRMERGVMNVVLSTAACSLMLPPLIKLAMTGQRRATVQLAVTSALAILAGQGYLQIGAALSYLPAGLILWVRNSHRPKGVWKEFILAGLLAILLAAVLLVPLLHFWPNFEKLADPSLTSAQPLEYVPLNFVIRDMAFFQNDSLQKAPVPYFYMNYIGWVPVLLAMIGLRLIPRSSRRVLVFLLVALGLTLLATSAVSLRLLEAIAPGFISGIRYPVFIAGLAVPILLALAAWGLDLLVQQNWPRLNIRFRRANAGSFRQIEFKWLVLAIPLIWSIGSAYEFSARWLITTPTGRRLQPVIDEMKPATAQWIGFPFSESFWLPAALDANLKVSPTYRPWRWKDRAWPPAHLEATRDPRALSAAGFIKEIPELYQVQHVVNEYAYIDDGLQQLPCLATALGGNIDVDCESGVEGTLIVREYSWTGWYVSRDGAPADLGGGPWLNTAATAGQHHYEFRYRPWDVIIGLLLTLGGIGLSSGLWLRSSIKPGL